MMAPPDANRSLVVAIGGSAGSINSLMAILAALPSDFAAILLVAIHRRYGRKSLLPAILRRSIRLKVVEIFDSATLETATVYISEPSEHLSLCGNGYHARLLPDPDRLRRNQSIDELFISLAEVAGASAVGVLLSGLLCDGTEGLRAIKRAGGITIVQDPADAKYEAMPANALRAVAIDYVLDHRLIAPVLIGLSARHARNEQAETLPAR